LNGQAAAAGGRPAPRPEGLSVAEAFAEFWRRGVQHFRDERVIDRFDQATKAVTPVCGHLPAASFGLGEMEDVRLGLLGRKPPLARGYINALMSAVKQVVAWLHAHKLVSAAVLADARALKALGPGDGGRETGPVPPVEEWVVEATLPHLSPTVAAMVRVQRLTGARPGELCAMRPKDVSRAPAERVVVPGTGRSVSAQAVGDRLVWLYCPGAHKNLRRGKPRVIAVGPEAQAVLGPLLERRASGEFVFRPADALSPARCEALGVRDYYTVRSFRTAIRRAVARANRLRQEAAAKGAGGPVVLLPPWHPHQLRHAAAEEIADVLDADAAGAALGHSASRRALDSYVLASIRKAAEAAAKVG
jgi:integrase